MSLIKLRTKKNKWRWNEFKTCLYFFQNNHPITLYLNNNLTFVLKNDFVLPNNSSFTQPNEVTSVLATI